VDLLDTRADSGGLTIQYSSPAQAAIVLSRKPNEILLDGRLSNLQAEARGGEWVLTMPRGTHTASFNTVSAAGVAVGWWSEIWSWLIALAGAVVILFMLWLYVRIRLRPANTWRTVSQSGDVQ
jgi:hypothetical protein